TVHANSTASVTSSVNPGLFGQPVTFTGTVSPSAPGTITPTGIVTFFDGAAALGQAILNSSGQASLATSGLAQGNHSITVSFGGDTKFNASTSGAYSQTVNQDSSSTALASSVNPSVFGQNVTFTATVTANSPGSGTPGGTVTFFDGASSLGTGSLGGGTASIA